MSTKMDMDITTMSLDDIIKKQKSDKRGGRRNENNRKPRNGPRKSITKPADKRNSKKWGNDKFFEMYKGRRQSGGPSSSSGGSGKAICRLSNIPFNIGQDELDEVFAEYRLTRLTLHYDYRGRSLGTAELHGQRDVIARLARDFRSVEIDGRPLGITVVDESGSAIKGGLTLARRGGDKRPLSNNIRRNRVNGASDGNKGRSKPKKLTAEELDRELEEYMKSTKQ